MVNALCFIGTEVNTLRSAVGFQIFILNILPAHTPDHSVFAFVPVHGVFLVAFPVAGGETDSLSVLVKVINLSCFRKPLSVFVHRSHCQQNMSVWIMTGRVGVVNGNVGNHPLGNKKLVAVFFDELHILFFGDFSRKWKMKSSSKL